MSATPDTTGPITPQELEEMKRRCETLKRVVWSSSRLSSGSQQEDVVMIQAADEPTVRAAFLDLPLYIAEIERLQGLRLEVAKMITLAEAYPIPGTDTSSVLFTKGMLEDLRRIASTC